MEKRPETSISNPEDSIKQGEPSTTLIDQKSFWKKFPSGDFFDKEAYELAARINNYFGGLNEKDARALFMWVTRHHDALPHDKSLRTMAKLAKDLNRPLTQIIAASNSITENGAKCLLAKKLMSGGAHGQSRIGGENLSVINSKYFGLDGCPDEDFIQQCIEYGIRNRDKLTNYEGFMAALTELGLDISGEKDLPAIV